ncbi:MAG: hypothetical protein C0407_08460 [Desulfobacca sp.]|nr:hypothetical protein [Desulfobacca sp.]
MAELIKIASCFVRIGHFKNQFVIGNNMGYRQPSPAKGFGHGGKSENLILMPFNHRLDQLFPFPGITNSLKRSIAAFLGRLDQEGGRLIFSGFPPFLFKLKRKLVIIIDKKEREINTKGGDDALGIPDATPLHNGLNNFNPVDGHGPAP